MSDEPFYSSDPEVQRIYLEHREKMRAVRRELRQKKLREGHERRKQEVLDSLARELEAAKAAREGKR